MDKMNPKSTPLSMQAAPKPIKGANRSVVIVGAGLTTLVLILMVLSFYKKFTQGTPLAEAESIASDGNAQEYALRITKPFGHGIIAAENQGESPSETSSLIKDVKNRQAAEEEKESSSSEDEQWLSELRRKAYESDSQVPVESRNTINNDLSRSGEVFAPRISSQVTAQSAVHSSLESLSAALGGEGQNLQDRKEEFLKRQSSDFTLIEKRMPSTTIYEVKAGAVIPAMMIGGINSDLPGPLIAQVSSPVYDTAHGDHIVIPQGAKLFGAYDSHIAYGQERVLVAWNRIVFPDASHLNIGVMPGADAAGYAGFYDQVNNHYVKIFGAAFIMSLITAGTYLAQPAPEPFQQTDPRQEISRALAQQLGQTAQSVTQKNLNVQPTLEIRPGYRFNVIVMKDMKFKEPYSRWDSVDMQTVER